MPLWQFITQQQLPTTTQKQCLTLWLHILNPNQQKPKEQQQRKRVENSQHKMAAVGFGGPMANQTEKQSQFLITIPLPFLNSPIPSFCYFHVCAVSFPHAFPFSWCELNIKGAVWRPAAHKAISQDPPQIQSHHAD